MSKELLLTPYENELIDTIKNCTVAVSIKSVSRSGMTRKIDFYVICDSELISINNLVAKIAGYRQDKNGCLIVGGCGMDMVFSVLYNFNMSMLHLKGHKRNDFSHSENCRFWIDSNNYQLL